MVNPFTIAIPQQSLDDLTIRLENARWPDDADGPPWDQGADLGYLKELTEYWLGPYDWRAQETALNALPQFTAHLGEVTVHFVHQRSDNPDALPLLLVHGWPDGFHRFQDLIPLLTGSFHVVAPSIPGFGFSSRTPLSPSTVAGLFTDLMTKTLDYQSFCAHAGDIGVTVVKALAAHHPDVVRAIHLTDVGYPTGREDLSNATDAERAFATATRRWVSSDGAYLLLQSTKPQTIAYSLDDSPVGLAAWIVSMIKSQAEDVDAAFGSRDRLLTNIMIYWLTRTAGSAARMYRLISRELSGPDAPGRGSVAAGIALFPRELQFPREWAERSLTVQRFTTMPRGGHFAALEEPELLAGELLAFFS